MDRKIVAGLAALGIALCGWSSGAKASDIQFNFVGIITQATATGAGPNRIAEALIGRPLSAQFDYTLAHGTLYGSGSYTTNFAGVPGIFAAPEFENFVCQSGSLLCTVPLNGGGSLTDLGDGSYVGSAFSLTQPTASFTYTPFGISSLTATALLLSINRADDHGTLTLSVAVNSATSNVSPVPVPATLPLFGFALFGLGVLEWARRRQV